MRQQVIENEVAFPGVAWSCIVQTHRSELGRLWFAESKFGAPAEENARCNVMLPSDSGYRHAALLGFQRDGKFLLPAEVAPG